jgi:tetratricopeptide (TPR) repeat protein
MLQGPARLPPDAAWFTGREAELARLSAIAPDQEQDSTVVITPVNGVAGIGTTAFAVHAGHRIAERYPDGQLFLDLHGFTEGATAVEPADALDLLLHMLGVPGDRVPADLDGQVALWRRVLADRRVLIVLVNAATGTQVAPLLPGSPGCLVLVTSRHHPDGLRATHTVPLDVLTPADAATLFARAAGHDGLAIELPRLCAEAVDLCGRVPLAIRIAAAQYRHGPAGDLADLVEWLRVEDRRLPEPGVGAARGVTASLELAYRRLTAEQQRLYRLLGLHPGRDVDPYASAALAGTTAEQAGRLLGRILELHLLQESFPGRYAFHDLVRVHAAGAAARDEDEPARRAALTRLLDHYRDTASAAMDSAYPYERDRRPGVRPATTPAVSDPTRAAAWLDTELSNMLAAARHVAGDNPAGQIRDLAANLHRHLRSRGRYRDAEALHRCALATARAAGDRTSELDALTRLADIKRLQGRHEQALQHFVHALDLARAAGDRTRELEALRGLGMVHRRQGRHDEALDDFGQALATARAAGNRQAELNALNGLGDIHRRQGRYWQALEHFTQALGAATTMDHGTAELNALNGLGDVHCRQGRYWQALEHFTQALEIARAIGHRPAELNALNGLGDVHRRQGRYQQAHDHYQQVIGLARESGERAWHLEARYGLARLHYAADEPEAAIAHHRQALELATDLGQPLDQARAHDGIAHACLSLNQHEQACEHWRQALDILTRSGVDQTEDGEAGVSVIQAHLTNAGGTDHRPV